MHHVAARHAFPGQYAAFKHGVVVGAEAGGLRERTSKMREQDIGYYAIEFDIEVVLGLATGSRFGRTEIEPTRQWRGGCRFGGEAHASARRLAYLAGRRAVACRGAS